MEVEHQLQHVHMRLRTGGHRAYMNVDPDELSPKEEKQTQTELGLISVGMTRFVTPRPVLSSETTDAPFAKAFTDICKQIRSPAWKSSLLMILGHDPERCRDELERKIREDEASEAIDGMMRAFFDTVLAPLMQDRETTLVNTIHECVQQEMKTQQLIIQNQQQHITQLKQQIDEWEKQVVHLKGKVDRRVAENNALRKEQYRQLLMLRDIMTKQGTEPGALSIVNEAIATVLAGKQQTPPPEISPSINDQDQSKAPGRGWMAVNANTQGLHREKEKWEQRAREATLECQELRDKIVSLTQENMKYRASESTPWFLKPENAIAERQRIADAVGLYQENWEDIGDSLVELLNNDILWSAVEQSARRGGKRRNAKGLEAVLAQIDSSNQPSSMDEDDISEKEEEPAIPPFGKRQSTFDELGRLIPCRACNGVGYIHADQGETGTNDSDSYLRKTLEQVLELKIQLDKANTNSLALEGQLQLSHMHAAQLQEQILQAELVKTSAVDSCLQTDLDDEEGLDLDEIMSSAYGETITSTDALQTGVRRNRRNAQYEHLIVELKNSLADKDEGLAESRKALEVAQTRTVSLQRALQKEKDKHSQELTMLKTSLTFSLKTRNTKIEERQAAVKLLIKKFVTKSPQLQSVRTNDVSVLPPTDESEYDEKDDDYEDYKDNNDSIGVVDENESDRSTDQSEVKRMEALTQRYAEDIVRVRKEHETQKELLKKAEAEIAEEDEKRNRTNSISQGSLVVNLASHPRDLFKALSTAQTDILKLRRASQRSSALQTDRLLTLTTHLGHMSEELCMLRKRNLAELEFWKLECEKLQNTNKALEAEQQIYRNQLQEARDQDEFRDTSGICSICEKHKRRLMQISNELLNQAQTSQMDPEVEVPASSTMTESERKLISGALLDLESIYTGMPAVKQQLARELVAIHIGNFLSPRTATRRTMIDRVSSPPMVVQTNNQNGTEGGSPLSTKSVGSSPRKNTTSVKSSKSGRQLKKTGEVLNNKESASRSPTRSNPELSKPTITSEVERAVESTENNEPSTSQEIASATYHRKTMVHEILDGRAFSLIKHVLPNDKFTPKILEMEIATEKNFDLELGNTTDTNTTNAVVRNKPFDQNEYEPQDVPVFDDENDLTLEMDEPLLMDCSSDIQRDPEVIQQLRRLINENAVAKERLAVTKWQVLVCRMLCLAGEYRLDQLKFFADRRAKIHPDGTLRPVCLKIISTCDAMIKIVQQRKIALAMALSAREIAHRDVKNAQAQLMHGVSMLLDNLSRKGKPKIELRELLYPSQGGSPRRSPTSNRQLYPSTKVHLNHLPQTQQIPTLTFPALVRPHSYDRVRPSTLRYNSERSTEESSYRESSQLPHRLTKSAGPRPFHLVHSSIGPLQGSMPFPDPVHIRNLREPEGRITPVRPHSSPAGPRLMSPRVYDFVSSTSSLYRPGQLVESELDTEMNSTDRKI